jgi:homoserine O-acetyltransferase/O-succinyltransferase
MTRKTSLFRKYTIIIPLLSFLIQEIAIAQESSPSRIEYANLGDFRLENGSVIRNCKLAYQVYGKPNRKYSNVILFPTWFLGTTNDLVGGVPGQLIDTVHYYLILVDALGDGLSSSPSNSVEQPRLAFPRFTIEDMVESEYVLLTQYLHINHLCAIAGISMGGMQAFQWGVSHPDFMDKIIPIVGSPQLNSSDLLLWNGELQAIQRDTAYHHGDYEGVPPIPSVSIMHQLAMHSPAYIPASVPRDSFESWLMRISSTVSFDWNNRVRQLQAMISNDIAKTTNGSLKEASKKIHAKLLVIVSKQDHMVNPLPAIRLAKYKNAQLIALDNNCGHTAFDCEHDKIQQAIRVFLSGTAVRH